MTHPLVERLGWTLVHFLWQGFLIASLYWPARALRGASEARLRYGLACASLAAMAAAPVVTFRALAMAPAPAPAATALFERVLGQRPVSAPAPGGVPFATLSTAPAPQPAVDPMACLVALWVLGASALSLRLIGGSAVARRLGSTAGEPPPEWQRALDSLAARAQVAAPVRLLRSTFVHSPAVIGWLKPVILLPAATLGGIAPEHIEALLAHELAHIRRGDYFINLLQRVVETLLFYHPAVWWLSAQITAEREACCDDAAVALTGDRLTYVCALASLESRRFAGLPAAVAANGGSLRERVARLLGQQVRPSYPLPGAGLLAAGLLIGLGICTLLAQSADARPAFEAASLKSNQSGTGVDHIKQTTGSLVIENVSLHRLIGMAYGVPDGREYLFKGPDWMDESNYDIYARYPAGTTEGDVKLMLQRLLDERFHLKMHREPREFNVFALVVARPGPNLHPTATPGPYKFSARGGHAVGVSVTMAQFADRLSRSDFRMGRQVIDGTGLEGQYDLTLDWQPDADQPGAANSDRPALVTALAQQLGLRLDPRRATIDVLVVDTVSKAPVEN